MEQTRTPIEQFFHQSNANVDMLYEAMPYVNMTVKKPLALFIKFQEIQEIMQGFNNRDALSACGLDETSNNIEDMLSNMRKKATGSTAIQLDSILNIVQTLKIYRAYQETLRMLPHSDHPAKQSGQEPNSANTNELLNRILPMLLSRQTSSGLSTQEISDLITQNLKGETYESELA